MTSDGRRSGDLVFAVLFAAYTGAVAIWLSFGVLPALAGSSPSLLALLREWASGTDAVATLARRTVGATGSADPPVRVIFEYGFSTLNVGVALFLVAVRPRDLMARLLAVAMIGTAATFNHQSHAFFTFELLGPPTLVEDLHTLLHIVSGLAYMLAVVSFPDGRLVPSVPRPWGGARAGVYALAGAQVALAAAAGRSEGHPGQGFFVVFFGIAIPLVGVVVQTFKARSLESVQHRRMARLLRGALVPLLIAGSVAVVARLGEDVGAAAFPALFALVPAVLTVAILRYRLLDIEVVVRQALVYGALASILVVAYVAATGTVGAVVGSSAGLPARLLATGVVAVAFDPLRTRLRAAVTRLVYGGRAAPYEALSALTERLASTFDVEDVLPTVASTTAGSLRALGGWASVILAGGERRLVMHGATTGERRGAEVRHGGEPVGEIGVVLGRGGSLPAADVRLLRGLADQAGAAFAAVRLVAALEAENVALGLQAAALRRSRRRLVRARLAAQIEVERAIQRRVSPRLAEARAALASPSPDLERATSETRAALEALRELARGVFPPILADQGLGAALESAARSHGIKVRLDETLQRRRLPPVVELGAYFCLAQAWSAGPVRVSAWLARADSGDWLCLRIAGGGGVPDLALISDRIEALGGDLVPGRRGLQARLPLSPLGAG